MEVKDKCQESQMEGDNPANLVTQFKAIRKNRSSTAATRSSSNWFVDRGDVADDETTCTGDGYRKEDE